MKTQLKREMWEIWKDGFISRRPYRMMTPIGVLAFRIKRHATAARSTHEHMARVGRLVR